MIVETRFPGYAETDQMGIVHHSVYPIWLKRRTDFIKHYGIAYNELEELGLMLPLIKLVRV